MGAARRSRRGLQPDLHADPRVRRTAGVYHIDLYRLDEAREVATLGLDEIFDREALVLIEWGERFPQLMPRGAHRDPTSAPIGETTKGKSKSDKCDDESHEQTTLGPDSGRQQRLRRGHRDGTGARRDEHFRRAPGPPRQAAARGRGAGEAFARWAANASSSISTPPTRRSARSAWRQIRAAPGRSGAGGWLRVLMHSLAWGALKPLAGARDGCQQEAARIHRRYHGPLAGLLGAGLPAGRAVRQGRADLRHDQLRRHARHSGVRAGERRQGNSGSAHPATGAGTGARRNHRQRDSGRASPIRPRCA